MNIRRQVGVMSCQFSERTCLDLYPNSQMYSLGLLSKILLFGLVLNMFSVLISDYMHSSAL